jgi:glycosyltransferase involved in cell wall biosynthesis
VKILQVVPFFPPAWNYGGVCRFAYELSAHLAAQGHEVVIFTTDAGDLHGRSIARLTNIQGVTVRRFANVSNYLAWKYNAFLSPGFVRALRHGLPDFDVIHLHNYQTWQNFIVATYAYALKKPVVLQAHGSLSTEFGRSSLKKAFEAVAGPRLRRATTEAVALNETERNLYEGIGIKPAQVRVIPTAVEYPPGRPGADTQSFHKFLGVDPTTKLVLYLGRLHRTKGIELLVEAFGMLLREHPDLVLAMVGPDDGYRARIEALVRRLSLCRNVLITGFVASEMRMSALEESELLVVPSFQGFPVTILEAWSVATPVVTTEKSDRLAWLDGTAGYVVPFRASDLTEAIRLIITKPSIRKELGENAKMLVEKHFSWSTVTEQFVRLYRDCIKRAG